MEVAIFMIIAALLMGLIFLMLFIWATSSGQFDDLDTPSNRILNDDIDNQITRTKDGK